MALYSASSLKQQAGNRHVASLAHIILILNQPVFAFSPKWRVLREEATHAHVIVFGLTRSVLEPTNYRTGVEHANHYTTNVVHSYIKT